MVLFRGTQYSLVLTDHAKIRMAARGINEELVKQVIENGTSKKKPQQAGAYWVFLEIQGRSDNLICVSLVLESKLIILKKVLVNWRPE
jgi:Domain of unknown function (DUF4258)